MANEKVLILEAPWSDDIEDTSATRDIYAAAETLLRTGDNPVRMIHRPLISTTYRNDIEQFADLDCNQRGPNVIILSGHGEVRKKRTGGRRVRQRRLTAFDGEINLSVDIRSLRDKLARSIIVLDSCELGKAVDKFQKLSGALGVVGFREEVDWVDSSMFVLAMLFKLHEEEVLSRKRAIRSTETRRSGAETVIMTMIDGPYASMAKSLGVRTAF